MVKNFLTYCSEEPLKKPPNFDVEFPENYCTICFFLENARIFCQNHGKHPLCPRGNSQKLIEDINLQLISLTMPLQFNGFVFVCILVIQQ